MAVTQKDIANKLKLSQSLVAGVLGHKENVWASQTTRRRIYEAASELNYVPHAAARALSSGKTGVVCAILTVDPDHAVALEGSGILAHIALLLARSGYAMLVKPAAGADAALVELRRTISARSCDAFLLWGGETAVAQQGCLLESLGIPFVARGRYDETHSNWMQADFAHEWMMAEAVSRLRDRGHERIALLGIAPWATFAGRLLTGFREAMAAQCGGAVDEILVEYMEYENNTPEQIVAKWMSLPVGVRPTAVVSGTMSAWNGMELGAAKFGVKLGFEKDELSVIGQVLVTGQLLFGEADAFVIDFADIGDALVTRLLTPALNGQAPANPIVHVRPQLRPMPSLRIPLP